MTAKPNVTDDGRTVTVRVPISVRSRGGRKLVLAPDGTKLSTAQVLRQIDSTMVKAIARAHRWKRLLESGQFASVTELAEAEKINQSYMCRVLRLTLLAPDIVESIIDGRQPPELRMDMLLKPFSVEWWAQRSFAILGTTNFGSAQPEKNR